MELLTHLREEVLLQNKDHVKDILEIINTTTRDFKHIPSIDKTLAYRYHQQIEDIREWLKITEWSQELISNHTLSKIQEQLFSLDIIGKKIDSKNLIFEM